MGWVVSGIPGRKLGCCRTGSRIPKGAPTKPFLHTVSFVSMVTVSAEETEAQQD